VSHDVTMRRAERDRDRQRALRAAARAGSREAYEELVLGELEAALAALTDEIVRRREIVGAGRRLGFVPDVEIPGCEYVVHGTGNWIRLVLLDCSCAPGGTLGCRAHRMGERASLDACVSRPSDYDATLRPWPDAFRFLLRNCPTRS